MELLKLYAPGIPDEQLNELKDVVTKFLFDKARDEADAVWEQKRYDQNTVHSWLNED